MTGDVETITNAFATQTPPSSDTENPQEAMNQASSSNPQTPNSPKSKQTIAAPQDDSIDADIDAEQDSDLPVIDLTPAANDADDQEAHSESLAVSSDTVVQDDDPWNHDLKRVKVRSPNSLVLCGNMQSLPY